VLRPRSGELQRHVGTEPVANDGHLAEVGEGAVRVAEQDLRRVPATDGDGRVAVTGEVESNGRLSPPRSSCRARLILL
jgi:hypothetical protein